MAIVWILAALLLLVAVVLGAGYALFRYAMARDFTWKQGDPEKSPWRPYREQSQAWQDAFWALGPTEVSITSFDGLKLVGHYLPAEGSRRTILLMHGYRCKGGAGDFAPVLGMYHDMGLNILLIDQRSHAASEGKYITFGALERYDCKAWLEYLNAAYQPTDLFMAGVSMGCATVVLALGLELPANLRGVIADCGFTSPWDINAHVLRLWFHLPPFPMMPAANFFCKRIAKFDMKGCSTLDAFKNNRVPVFFIHGAEDDFVPTDMTRRNEAVCAAPHELAIVPGAGHALSLWVDGDALRPRIRAFIERYSSAE